MADFKNEPLHQNIALYMFNASPEGIPEQADGVYLHADLFAQVLKKCPISLRCSIARQMDQGRGFLVSSISHF
jgi:hypothetical protein